MMQAVDAHPLELAIASASAESLEANLTRWHRFAGSPAWMELQALSVRGERSTWEANRFAHADTVATAVRLAQVADRWICPGVYVIANPIQDAVATRAIAGQWHDQKGKGTGTSDSEIASRTILTIDVDVDRPKDTSATLAEMEGTERVALAIHSELSNILEGDTALGYAHTGNGRMVFIALDSLDRDIAGRFHHAILLALDARYTNAKVELDLSVHDAKRLVPCWGTSKKKGAPGIESRPHRRTAFVCGDAVSRVSMSDLERVLSSISHGLDDAAKRSIDKALGIKAAPKASTTSTRLHSTDVFAQAKECPIADVLSALGLLDGDDPVCPGCGLHGDSSVAIVGNGLKCSHNRCASKGHKDGFRTTIDVVMECKGLSNIEAVRWLGDRFGFDVPTGQRQEEYAANDNEPGEPPPGFYDEPEPVEPVKPKPRRGRTPVDILDAMAASPVIHLPTGIAALDDATGGGPRFRDLVSVLGAPDAGKTLLLAQIADTLAERADLIVAEYCVDEDGEDNVTRLAQRRGWLRSEVEQRIDFASLRPRLPTNLRIYGDDDTVEDVLRELAELSAAECKRVVLFVDSLQTISVASVEADASPTERVARALSLLKKACSCGWLIFLTSEMVRNSYSGNGERTATLAAAKWSGDVEYKSKIQMGVRSVDDSPDLIEVDIAKNKAGPKTKFHLRINRAKQLLEPAEAPAEVSEDATSVTSAKTDKDAERVFKVVLRHPGIGARDLRARSQLGPDACHRAVMVLLDDGRIENRPETKGTRDFPHFYAISGEN